MHPRENPGYAYELITNCYPIIHTSRVHVQYVGYMFKSHKKVDSQLMAVTLSKC